MRPDSSFVEQPVRSLQTMLRVIAMDDSRYQNIIPDGIYGAESMLLSACNIIMKYVLTIR